MKEKEPSTDNLTRSIAPKPSLAISRKGVLAFGIALSIMIVLAIQLRKAPPEIKSASASETKASPGYAISTLPTTYADLPPSPPPPAPRVQYIEKNSGDELAKVLAQMEAERQKRRVEARRASLSFQGVSLAMRPDDAVLGSLAQKLAGEKEEGRTSQDPRDIINRQDDKINFLDGKRIDSTSLRSRLQSPRSEYELLSGALVPGLLLTGINSDLPGYILGQVSQNVYDTVSGRYLLIPQGTKILGQYDSRIVYGQERVLVVWTRLVFPNGRSISLEGMAGVDLSGYAGLTDKVNNHYFRLLTGVIFSSLLGAGAQLAEGRNYSTIDPSYAELAAQGAARNLNDAGQQITRRNLNVQPTLEIRPGFRFNVFVHKDVVLEPYVG